MAKTKIIYGYLLWFLISSGAAGQDHLSSREQLQQVYRSQVGVKEQGGANRGEQVEQYLASVGLGPGYAWCAAFVSWCLQQVDVEHPKSAWVPSYARKQRLIYQRGKFIYRMPQTGDVFLIWYSRLNRPAHIGFVDQWHSAGHARPGRHSAWVITVEGNTNEDGSREGDGVYRKRRLQRQIWAVADFIDP